MILPAVVGLPDELVRIVSGNDPTENPDRGRNVRKVRVVSEKVRFRVL